ncbi:MAG TPA: FecR domain-containing protein, partial [Chthoniobacterales bacterium]|nr:FecR domain-containing protein [Chthoniobacterales bacterium]
MNLASRLLAGSMASLAVLAPQPTVTAASSEARVTQIIRDVKLLPSEADARPAAVDDKVSEDTAVRTGGESRSELTFADLTITRLGADTIFSFSKAGRTAKLDSGSILLRVPKDSRGGAINTHVVTVAITGTTVIFESDAAGNSKLITLEGRARLSLVKDPRRVRNVRAGQMLDVPPDATMLPVPVEVDLDELTKTHPLITDFAPLPSQDLIAAVALRQRKSSPGEPPGIRPRPSPSPSATRPQRSPSPTPRIVTPTPSPKPSVTPTSTPTSTPKLTPTPRPTPSETPTPKPSPTASPTPAPSPSRGPYDYWTPTPPPRPSPTASPTPPPSPTRGRYEDDSTPTSGGRISP